MIVRKSYPELTENHIKPLREKLKIGTPDALARYNDSRKEMIFLNGSTILFRYCDTEKDVDRYQGTEVDVLFLDEATQLTEMQIKKITACVRGVNQFPKRIYYTMNPGGVGHGYMKRLFIDREYKPGEDPDEYNFIQSLVTDNKALMKNDPEYIKQLEALPDKLRKAWLEGSFDIYEGQFFEEFTNNKDGYINRKWTHVIEPFDIPMSWRIYMSYDFGYSRPFAAMYWAVDPDGRVYQIAELYGCTGEPNEGVKWIAEEQFSRMRDLEATHPLLKGRKIAGRVADPAIWDGSRGKSIEETAAANQIYFQKGINDRIAGWMQCHYYMAFSEDGYPMLYFFNTCKNSIRTIPLMVYDETHVEDMDTSMEDHCLVADTQVLTGEGYKNIADMVGTEGYVLSSDGKYHKYSAVRVTRRQTEVFKVTLEDGTTFTGTKDHRIMLDNGEWCTIENLLGKELYDGCSSDIGYDTGI